MKLSTQVAGGYIISAKVSHLIVLNLQSFWGLYPLCPNLGFALDPLGVSRPPSNRLLKMISPKNSENITWDNFPRLGLILFLKGLNLKLHHSCNFDIVHHTPRVFRLSTKHSTPATYLASIPPPHFSCWRHCRSPIKSIPSKFHQFLTH